MSSDQSNSLEGLSQTDSGEFDRIDVLLVDDDQDFVSLASALLESENERIETTTHTNPLGALDRTDLAEIDCIVSDYRMPEMNGIEFLETVREEYPELPFILFTGKGGEDVAERAISAGVSDYIVKDGSPEQYAISANRIENLVLQYRTRQRWIQRQVLDTLCQSVLKTVLSERTREAIEQGVCDRLAALDLYSFAWIGERDLQSGAVRPRAWAGDDEFLDSVSFSVDRDPPRSVEERALTTGERRIESGFSESGRWHSEAERHGFEAALGHPIVHEDIPYGVLGVYTERSNAFSSEESSVLGLIADLTAFSVGANERRRGDTSRQIIEVEFAVEDTDLPFVRIASTLGGTVRFVQTAYRSDGTGLTLYSVADASREQLSELDALLDLDVARVSDRTGAESEIAIVSSDPWWRELIDLYGANIAAAVADGEGATLLIELHPNSDVRSVVSSIEERYPGAEPVARRERTRSERSIDDLEPLLKERLTDRQRDVLTTAYHAGYYEWPHEASSEEVAELLGITQPTFAEHFWTAQRRIVELFLETEESKETD